MSIQSLSSTGSGRRARCGGSARRRARGRAGECRVQGTELDVGVRDLCVGAVRLDIVWRAGVGGACTARDSGGGGVGIGGVVAVEPEHADIVVVPETQHQRHAVLKGVTHTREAALRLEGVGIAEEGLLRSAVVLCDGVVVGEAGESGVGVRVDDAVLDVETADLGKLSAGGAIVSDELRDDGELGARVDCLSGAIEVGVTLAEGVEVAAVLVANTAVAVVSITAISS